MRTQEELLTAIEASAYLGISARTLRKSTDVGILNCQRANLRGDRRYSKSCLDSAKPPKKTGRPRKKTY